MYHSIYIGEKNTWDDFRLIPTSRPSVSLPEPRTVYIDVPGADGAIDMTTALTGSVLYKNREGSWEFIIANSMPFRADEEWTVTLHRLMQYLHGKRFRVSLEDEPNYYYMGRLSVESFNSDDKYSKVTIKYSLEPYKYEAFNNSDWLWDPFSFETGIARDYTDISVSVDRPVSLFIYGTPRPTIPKFTATTHDIVLTYNGNSYPLINGENVFRDIIIGEAGGTVSFSGSGTVTIDFLGGWL